MPRFEVYASDHALQYFSFSREKEEGESERDAALELVRATVALMGDWIAPLTVDVRVESCDPSNYYSEDSDHPPQRAAWFLRRHQVDERLFISEMWVDVEERRVDVIGEVEILELVGESLAQSPPREGVEVTLAELAVRSAAIVLPPNIDLALTYGGGSLTPVLVGDGGRQLAIGPDSGPVGPPVRVHAYNSHGETSLQIELHWDLWRAHPAGIAQARAAVERVLARGRGWHLKKERPPLPK